MTNISDLIAAHDAANKALSAYARDVVTPANEAWRTAVAAIPHVRTVNSFENWGGERITLTTADAGSVLVARKSLRDMPRPSIADEDFYLTREELVEAADKRDLEEARLKHEYRIEEIDAEYGKLEDAHSAAWRSVMDCPVLWVDDWLLKVEFAREHADGPDEESWSLVLDAKRLLTEVPA